MNIKEQTLLIIESQRGNWKKLASESGVSYDWISSVAQGRIENPGITNVNKLIAWQSQQENNAA